MGTAFQHTKKLIFQVKSPRKQAEHQTSYNLSSKEEKDAMKSNLLRKY